MATVVLLVAYAVTLAVGLSSLESPQQPIGDPMFFFMGLLAGVTPNTLPENLIPNPTSCGAG